MMNIELTEHIPAGFDDNSKVWIYQSSRLFLMSEAFEMEDMLNSFVAQWKSHGDKVKGYANLFFGQFIVIIADETHAAVGGCSTDSSVHVIKAIEQKFKVNMFDRQNLAFMIKDKVQMLPLSQLNYAAENNFITPDTLYFDNTVLTKKELLERWIVPVKDSWLGKRINFNKHVA
jgi:hypothetical protein